MSTKCTIKYGDDFHFYNECFDDSNVYLQLDTADIELYGKQVTLTIPKAIWAIIRESAPVELRYAKMKDEEIRSKVEAEVDDRISQYAAATTDQQRAWTNLMGCLCYGGADEPREKQIESGIKYYESIRKREKKILNKIRKYQRTNKR